MGSRMVDRLMTKGQPMILNMPDETWFDFKMMQKDVSLTAGRAMGLEKKDVAAVFPVLAKMSGVNE